MCKQFRVLAYQALLHDRLRGEVKTYSITLNYRLRVPNTIEDYYGWDETDDGQDGEEIQGRGGMKW